MGTSNFYTKNAKATYVVEVHEEWDYTDSIERIRESVGELVNYYNEDSHTDERNYTGKIICSFSREKYYGDTSFEVKIFMMLRSGYYKHCNIDYKIEKLCDGYEVIDHDQEYELDDFNGDLDNRYVKWVNDWNDKNLQELVEIAEKVCNECSTVYAVSARFSNGETWYQKIES